jgi:hypothetical protein
MSDSPYISLNEMALLTGKAKSTISKALKNGKMSYISKDPKTGAYEIDPSEAERVFPQKQETAKGYHLKNPRNPIENSALQIKLEVMEQRFNDAQATIEDLRTRLDTESAERRQLTALLTDQREKPVEEQRKGLWARLRG